MNAWVESTASGFAGLLVGLLICAVILGCLLAATAYWLMRVVFVMAVPNGSKRHEID